MVITPPVRAERQLSVILLATLTSAGCASAPVVESSGPAPNPNGCYAFVYDQPDLRGDRVVLNGPSKWADIERLRLDNKDWRNRLRSIEVGPAATVTVHTEPNYRGASRQFTPGTTVRRVDDALSGGVESVEISCRSKT